jgi:hypothetical protein
LIEVANDQAVRKIHTGRVNIDPKLASTWLWACDLSNLEQLGITVLRTKQCFHPKTFP